MNIKTEFALIHARNNIVSEIRYLYEMILITHNDPNFTLDCKLDLIDMENALERLCNRLDVVE